MPSERSQDRPGWIWAKEGAERLGLRLVGLYLGSMATKLGPGPLHSPRSPWEALFITLDHMGVRKSPYKVAQSNISFYVSISGGRKFRFAPNFMPMNWRTIDEVNGLKIDGKGFKATLSGGPRAPAVTYFHQTASSLDSMHTSTSGAMSCVHLWRFKVSCIQGWRRMITRIIDVAMEYPLLHLKL